jgi:hypothetical protein
VHLPITRNIKIPHTLFSSQMNVLLYTIIHQSNNSGKKLPNTTNKKQIMNKGAFFAPPPAAERRIWPRLKSHRISPPSGAGNSRQTAQQKTGLCGGSVAGGFPSPKKKKIFFCFFLFPRDRLRNYRSSAPLQSHCAYSYTRTNRMQTMFGGKHRLRIEFCLAKLKFASKNVPAPVELELRGGGIRGTLCCHYPNPAGVSVRPQQSDSRQGSALISQFTAYRRENRPATRQSAAFPLRFPPKTLPPAAISRKIGKKPPVFRP